MISNSKEIDNLQLHLEKVSLGQFYTTNYLYILEEIAIPNEHLYPYIIEPFAGEGDLLNFLGDENERSHKYRIECFDLSPKKDYIQKRDTLKDPPIYRNKYVLTNPPYLARNKNKDKELYDKYNTNDLYKCFIEQLINDPPLGGILIIPTNFWCSIRIADINLRRKFLELFKITVLKIFNEPVFNDTKYAVCCFEFQQKTDDINRVIAFIYSDHKKIATVDSVLNEENDYTFGGNLYKLPIDKNIKIDRLTRKNQDNIFITNINVKCIDDGMHSQLGLSYINDHNERYIDDTSNLSARSYATLIVKPFLTIESQTKLVNLFNHFLDEQRNKYGSLFLSNYRDGTGRKRISFRLVYDIVNYIIQKYKLCV